MWLLSTRRAELEYFTSPEAVEGGYAILSHVWEKEGEQTFQDLQRVREQCKGSSKNPRDSVGDKIRRCCELAERYGFKWVWIDTCCIDKSSSAALSEAINSMFRYYSRSQVCFAYLRDVNDIDSGATRVVKSKWFYRGWTLQELIGPLHVLFLSSSWTTLGFKADYASAIETEHGIPAAVLQMQAHPSEYSIAQRMSWAARRETTRVEDKAYSLLGLFDINMPTLYGEGEKAFRRLQEEIMRQCSDTTLFAWGHWCPSDRETLSSLDSDEGNPTKSGLFARSPRNFETSGSISSDTISFRPTTDVVRFRAPSSASFTLTPHGVLATHLPVVTVYSSPGKLLTFGDFSWTGQAVEGHPGYRIPIWLILTETQPVNSTRTFRVGSLRAGDLRVRLLSTQQLNPAYLTWWNAARSYHLQEVYLTSQPPSNDVGTLVPIPLPPPSCGLSPRFRFYEATLRKLHNPILEWQLDKSATRTKNTTQQSFRDDSPIIFLYRHRSDLTHQIAEDAHAFIAFGLCTTSGSRSSFANVDNTGIRGPTRRGMAHHWAIVRWDLMPDHLPVVHDCRTDHIERWPVPKTLALDKWNYLRFTQCPINPTTTVIVDIEEKRLRT